MKRIPDASVDCIITDLPYGTTACQWDSVIPFEPLWEQYRRITKPNAAIVLFGSEPFSSYLRISNIEWFRYDIVWQKTKLVNFAMTGRQPGRTHEMISIFYKHQPTYNPQMQKGDPYKRVGMRHHNTGDSIAVMMGQAFEQKNINDGTRVPTTIVTFSNNKIPEENFHPTQKPVDLLRYLILTYSNEGDTILDATIGSGTTAVAALMEKRHFIGFELNKEYFDKACKRIDTEQRQLTLF
jgi:site-specific DNA-methyltransferase (adenine-specific)